MRSRVVWALLLPLSFLVLAGGGGGGGNEPPTIPTSATPSSGAAPLTVQFSTERGYQGLSLSNYRWDFADGTTANGRLVTHTYPVARSYVATVRARAAAGLEVRGSVTVNVNEPVASATGIWSGVLAASAGNEKEVIALVDAEQTLHVVADSGAWIGKLEFSGELVNTSLMHSNGLGSPNEHQSFTGVFTAEGTISGFIESTPPALLSLGFRDDLYHRTPDIAGVYRNQGWTFVVAPDGTFDGRSKEFCLQGRLTEIHSRNLYAAAAQHSSCELDSSSHQTDTRVVTGTAAVTNTSSKGTPELVLSLRCSAATCQNSKVLSWRLGSALENQDGQ